MLYFWIMLLVIPSPIFMMISSEGIAVILSLKGYSPLWIALSLSIGQSIGFSLLYFFGGEICQRWTGLKKKIDTFDVARFQKRAFPFLCLASLIGLPPLNLSCIASSMLKYPYHTLLPIVFLGRFIRYVSVASIPQIFQPYFNPNWLPNWIQSI
jgi:membrane protein YqaA with SNARE-associated domain